METGRQPAKAEPEATLDMQPDDQRQLLDFLRCSTCGQLAEDAVDTLCCHALLCFKCLTQQLEGVCPICKRGCSSCENHLARRLIGCQPWTCESCGFASARSEAAQHRLLCPRQRRRCPSPGCEFCGLPDAFLDHLVASHRPQLLRGAKRLFVSGAPTEGDAETALTFGSPRRMRYELGGEFFGASRGLEASAGPRMLMVNLGGARDPSRTFANVTNKNYCGGELNGAPCDCCDGRCGPRNGCNCVDCMRRDLNTFGVRAGQRALVNREGVISTLSPETGKFYCGRANMTHDPMTDGFCGPNNGNNCHACRQLDRQARDRYANIVSGWG